MNGKKLSRFQFHFPGLLGTSRMSKQETFFFYNWTSEIIPLYQSWITMKKFNFRQFKKIQVLSICLPKQINGIISDVQYRKKNRFLFRHRVSSQMPWEVELEPAQFFCLSFSIRTITWLTLTGIQFLNGPWVSDKETTYI